MPPGSGSSTSSMTECRPTWTSRRSPCPRMGGARPGLRWPGGAGSAVLSPERGRQPLDPGQRGFTRSRPRSRVWPVRDWRTSQPEPLSRPPPWCRRPVWSAHCGRDSDGVQRQRQPGGDLLIGQSLGDEVENLPLLAVSVSVVESGFCCAAKAYTDSSGSPRPRRALACPSRAVHQVQKVVEGFRPQMQAGHTGLGAGDDLRFPADVESEDDDLRPGGEVEANVEEGGTVLGTGVEQDHVGGAGVDGLQHRRQVPGGRRRTVVRPVEPRGTRD